YPKEVITVLKNECNLSQRSVVADIGSGTGIFTVLLLKQGYKVYAVEPNEDMQHAAKIQFAGDDNFIPVNGNAEATTLKEKSIDLIVCAQAFHWFNNEKTRAEFKRILADEGKAALIWNNRLSDADEFSIAYENILKNKTSEYTEVNHRNINENDLKALFRNGEYKTAYYPNVQVFDEDGLMGRAFSSSYVPPEGTEEGENFRQLLKDIFEKYSKDGKVNFHYQTEIYLGKV
ncbi:MAG TPA: class I SAM-dependent methyltransferase, partial [Mucilaginibacter sp.]